MEDKSSKSRLLFRTACFLINVIGISYHCLKMDFEAYKVFGGRFKFLTFINMVLQGFYFTFAVSADLQTITRKQRNLKLHSFSDFFFATLAFPIGLTVCVLFWGLYLKDPHSCQTEQASKVIPRWLNHYMHSFPVLEVTTEVVLFSHVYPRKSSGLSTLLGFGASYMAWVFLIAYISDFWVYPFLGKMSLLQICVFFGGSGVLLVILYLLGEFLAMNNVKKLTKKKHVEFYAEKETKKKI